MTDRLDAAAAVLHARHVGWTWRRWLPTTGPHACAECRAVVDVLADILGPVEGRSERVGPVVRPPVPRTAP
ncbi:hypothetical protein PSD17_39550 [Pseudonocardia sp. D17]|nr:hypothetical protein PSD17_39550 [Pseudonocardia sp. D17]